MSARKRARISADDPVVDLAADSGSDSSETNNSSGLDGRQCEALCDQFAQVTGTDEACGHFFLQETNWNLETALENFFRASTPDDDGEAAASSSSKTTSLNGPKSDPQLQEPPKEFKLLSWNIDGLDERSLKTRMNAVLQIVENERPEVILLQEMIGPVYEAMELRLINDYAVVSGRDPNSLVQYFTCAAVKRSFAELKDLKIRLCGAAPESTLGDMCIMTTHLESTGEHGRERVKQLRTCLDALRTPKAFGRQMEFSLLAGDFNLRDKELAEIGGLGADIHDAWEQTGSKAYTRYTWDCVRNDNLHFPGRFKPRNRFDRCWYRSEAGWRCSNLMLVGMQRIRTTQCFPSDHFGLLCSFVRNTEDSDGQ